MSGVSVSPLRVVGFTCDAGAPYDFSKDSEEPCSSSSPSTKQKLPESPLGRLLRSDRPNGFPKLTLKSLGNPSGSSAGHFGLNISRRAMSAAVLGEDVPAPITPSCSRLSSSSEPIPIPEYCRPFRTESQPDAPLSGGWSGSHPANYFACSNGGAPVSVERDHSAFCAPPAGSRPPSSHRLPLCTDSAEFEPVTPCRPEVLTRQRSLLGLGSSTTATRSSSSAATVASHVLDQHFSHLEARVARQSKSIWELQGKLHEVKRQRDALLLQLEGRPEKTMRSCGDIEESEFLLASDEDLGCLQQHELHSAGHGPRQGALLFGH